MIKLLVCLLILSGIVFAHDLDATIEEVVDNHQPSPRPTVVHIPNQPYQTPSISEFSSSVYLAEHFDDLQRFKRKWIKSEAKKEGIDEDIAKYDGLWEVESAERDALEGDLGLVLKSKAKHSAIATKLDRPFVFGSKPLVVQYEVLHQNGQECGGAYLKLLSTDPASTDLRKLHDKTPYTIMFGPDKCGNDYKLHFIIRHKNPKNGTFSEKHCKKPKEKLDEPFTDKASHLYTLIIQPDNTFQILLDHKVVNEGSLLEDLTPSVNPPVEIDDPLDVKPADWDEREKIPDTEARKPDDWDENAPQYITDPSATKPADWLDDEPENIPDPAAEKPEDWDEEMDGDWEAPLVTNPVCKEAPGCGEWTPEEIVNPAYKGKWRPPLIENLNYRGKWAPRRIPNPEYFEDKNPFKMTDIFAVGFELWSMSNEILFDNIIITDDPSVARVWAYRTFDMKTIKKAREAESLVTAFLNFSNEHPWIWAVYVLVIGLPVVLVVFFCCSSSTQEKEDLTRRTEAKKTDEPQPDDEVEQEGYDSKETNKEEKQISSTDSQPLTGDSIKEQEPASDSGEAPSSPRKRRSRKD